MEDFLSETSPYFYPVFAGEVAKAKLGYDLNLEIIFKMTSRFGLSFRSGFTQRRIPGENIQFRPNAFSMNRNTYDFLPESNFYVVPLCLSGIFTIPLNPSFEMNLSAGLGYYLGIAQGDSRMLVTMPDGYEIRYSTANVNANNSGFGTHFGLSFDQRISSRLTLCVEGIYTKADITIENTSVRLTDKKILSYWEFSFSPTYWYYSVEKLKYSVLTIRVGIKMRI